MRGFRQFHRTARTDDPESGHDLLDTIRSHGLLGLCSAQPHFVAAGVGDLRQCDFEKSVRAGHGRHRGRGNHLTVFQHLGLQFRFFNRGHFLIAQTGGHDHLVIGRVSQLIGAEAHLFATGAEGRTGTPEHQVAPKPVMENVTSPFAETPRAVGQQQCHLALACLPGDQQGAVDLLLTLARQFVERFGQINTGTGALPARGGTAQ